MASQNEVHEESRDVEVEEHVTRNGPGNSESVNVESRNQPIEPFTDADPFIATRITETTGQVSSLLEPLSFEAVGFENLTNEQYRHLSEDAIERAKWPKAIQDEFEGFLRLGRPLPPRSKRVL